MKHKILLLIGIALPLFWSCSKDCDNLTNGELTAEEQKYILPSALVLTFTNSAHDTERVTVDAPVMTSIIGSGDCNYPGNERAEQLYHFLSGNTFKARIDHYNGEDDSRYLHLLSNNKTFGQMDLRPPHFTEIIIHSQTFGRVLVDSVTVNTNSPEIRKIWYGQRTGILQYEKWNGEIFSQEN